MTDPNRLAARCRRAAAEVLIGSGRGLKRLGWSLLTEAEVVDRLTRAVDGPTR